MTYPKKGLLFAFLLGSVISTTRAATAPSVFDVRTYGAKGDGKTLDSGAINAALRAAHAAGGGTVIVPAGTYLSGSIHLQSNTVLHLDPGSVITATKDETAYDEPEPNPEQDKGAYEDYGHRHWHNTLIWGESLENVTIEGPGLIEGKALRHNSENNDETPARMANKAIALKNCRNVTLRDFSMLYGGWFGILAIATDVLTLDNLKIDTIRDGMDIDCCWNVSVSNCYVNSPYDDGICLKSTFGLGINRACENISITNCHVSGFDVGTFLGGTFERKARDFDDQSGPQGRIKFGTESNGGYKNVTVSNCTFDYCRGLALETVDGGILEDVTITNITMRDVGNSPIYVRLGARNRGPAGTHPGALRRVTISNIVASGVDSRSCALIAALPDYAIEDLNLSNIRILYKGGGTAADAAVEPAENEKLYPEPGRHGVMPAYGFFFRHVKGLSLRDIDIRTEGTDARPPFVLEDVHGADFDHILAPHAASAPSFVFRNVSDFTVRASKGVADQVSKDIPDGKL